MNEFGRRIKDARVERGLTLESLARSASTMKGYISSLEHGKVNPPSPKATRRLARALGLDPEVMVALGWYAKRPAGVDLALLRRAIK